MKRVTLDGEAESTKKFFFGLTVDPDGSLVELGGSPVARVMPIPIESEFVDEAQLREAILSRRDSSRELNQDWEQVDRELWETVFPDPTGLTSTDVFTGIS